MDGTRYRQCLVFIKFALFEQKMPEANVLSWIMA